MAVTAYRKAIALQGKEATTHRNLGDALWMTGDRAGARAAYETAVSLATEAVRVNPANAHAMLDRLLSAQSLGDSWTRERISRAPSPRAPEDNDVAYKQAVVGAVRTARAALRFSETSLRLGYNKIPFAESDRDLDPGCDRFPAYKPR